MSATNFDGTSSEIRLPTKQELIDAMLNGTTIWWELVGGGWIFYYTDRKDVYDHVHTISGIRAFIRQYDRILSQEERELIFRREASLFAPKSEDGLVEIKR